MRLRTNSAFTLLELLIVIAILAVLATVSVLVINPIEYLRQSRDAKRIGDLTALSKTFELAEFEGASLGASTTVSISLPDNASSTCGSLTLPALPAPYTYRCVTAANLTNTNGTGWIPVDLSSLTGLISLASLPIDPVNSAASGLYYAYIPGGSFEVAAAMESDKYFIAQSKDAGDSGSLYENGSNRTLLPPVARAESKYASCKQIKDAFADSSDGTYSITFDDGGSPVTIPVYCDMTTSGGGWTLVQSTVRGQAADARWANSFAVQQTQTIGVPAATSAYRMPMKYWYRIAHTGWMRTSVTTNENRKTTNLSPAFRLTGVDAGPAKFTFTGADVANIFNGMTGVSTWNTCTNSVGYFNGSCCSMCILYNSGATYNTFNQPMVIGSSLTADDGGPIQVWSNYAPLERLNIFMR